MEIIDASARGKSEWNRFIVEQEIPVGAFMQSWEWGEFQQALGRDIERFFIIESDRPIAAFMVVRHTVRRRFSYSYAPRGPILSREAEATHRALDILRHIRIWAKERYSGVAFLRLEPPISSITPVISDEGFHVPSYYIQPRYNLAIAVDQPEAAIANAFHSTTRSNIRRAENRGVHVESSAKSDEQTLGHFLEMIRSTIRRNGGFNAYPDERYFRMLLATIPPLGDTRVPDTLSIAGFYGYQNGEPAGTHFVVYFGDTATYLFGASYADKLQSKVATYLHWTAMIDARKRGYKYYDLGGVDSARWPSLTGFKRQFGGKEYQYVGNIDIPLRPAAHWLYNIFQKFRK